VNCCPLAYRIQWLVSDSVGKKETTTIAEPVVMACGGGGVVTVPRSRLISTVMMVLQNRD
jgi:hypothetical protein